MHGFNSYRYPFEVIKKELPELILGRDLIELFYLKPVIAIPNSSISEGQTQLPKLTSYLHPLLIPIKKSGNDKEVKSIEENEDFIEDEAFLDIQLKNLENGIMDKLTDAKGNLLNSYEPKESRSKTFLSLEEEKERTVLLTKVKELLSIYRAKIKPDDPCSLPEATVRIKHIKGTIAKRRAQYKNTQERIKFMNDIIKDWIKRGWAVRRNKIKHPKFEWVHPLLGVDKMKDGKLVGCRITIDLKNTLNIDLDDMDEFPIPTIKSLIEKLIMCNKSHGGFIISDLDLKDAYFQMKIHEDDVHKLGFMWNGEEFYFTRAPQGLTTMTSTFQRFMATVFEKLHDNVLCYLDNVWVITPADQGMDGHLDMLDQVINRLAEINLNLNDEKCNFALKTFTGLGHRITPHGVYIDQKRSDSIMEIERPKTYHDLHSFLGLANQVRDHIRYYSMLVKPIQDLLKIEHKKPGWNSRKKPSKREGPDWTKDALKNFRILRYAIAHAPYITFPDPDKLMILLIDASINGIGVAMYQPNSLDEPLSQKNLVSFRSHALKDFQKNYAGSIYKLELWALVSALQDFEFYLRDRKFIVMTDHAALTHLNVQKSINRHLANWCNYIQLFDFSIVHLPGRLNSFADALSRVPPFLWGIPDSACNEGAGVVNTNLSVKGNCVKLLNPEMDSQHKLDKMIYEWKAAEVVEPHFTDADKLAILDRIHSIGHFGQRAMLDQLKAHNIKWTGMQRDVSAYTDKCDTCLRWNVAKKLYNGLRSIHASLPFDHLQVDLITSFPKTGSGNQYILVVVDIFTGYVILRSLKDKSAKSISDSLWEIFGIMGIPKIIQSDNGTEFVSEIITAMMYNLNIVHRRITAYDHKANGKVENTNKTVSICLHKMVDLHGGDWDRWLHVVSLAMNAKIRSLTGFSPMFLMFNRNTNLFDDIAENESVGFDKPTEIEDWIAHQKQVINNLFPLVNEIVKSKQLNQKIHYDNLHNVREQIIHIPVGTNVYLFDSLRANKNQPPYVGPYKVVEMTPAGHFKLIDTVGGVFHRDVTIDQLKVTNNSLPFGNNEHYVERILEHKQDPTNDSWLYKVRWIGVDPMYDEWIPARYIESSLINKYIASLSRMPKRTSTVVAKKRNASELSSAIVGSSAVIDVNNKKQKLRKNKSSKKPDIVPSLKVFKKKKR